jgi:hypothetical protein
MPDFSNFSSLPPNLEAGFVPYEQRMASASQSSFFAAIVAAIATFVIAIGIYIGVAPDETDVTKDMNMSNLSRTDDTGGSTGGNAPAAAPAASSAGAGGGSAAAAPAPAADGSGSAAAPAGSGGASGSGSN